MGIPLSQCPTCQSKLEVIDGVTRRHSNGFRINGKQYKCDCDTQIALRIQYLVAGIGDQYMRLDWKDYVRDAEISQKLQEYVENWDSYRIHGIGVELYSKSLATGKTLLATCIGKSLIKRGHKVFFVPFSDLVAVAADADLHSLSRRMIETNLLILDEIRNGMSEKQKMLFGDVLEKVIRERTSYNLPTVITTNLKRSEMMNEYPRTYSLLSAKVISYEMPGPDHRLSEAAFRHIKMAQLGEIDPII